MPVLALVLTEEERSGIAGRLKKEQGVRLIGTPYSPRACVVAATAAATTRLEANQSFQVSRLTLPAGVACGVESADQDAAAPG